MLGRRGAQRGLFEADTQYLEFVGRETFYGFLAAERGALFRDEDFAELDAAGNGRPSVPPSLLATALVLQTYDGVSDDEAKRRADYDLQWKVALGVEVGARPFAKSTWQEFRAQLIVHERQAAIFRRSLELAKRRGKLAPRGGAARRLATALDTTNILGGGAVKDTYTLLADGIVKLARVLAKLAGEGLADWAALRGYGRYVSEPSLKGAVAIDWGDAAQRRRVLGEIVADADRLLAVARQVRAGLAGDSAEAARVAEAAGLLSRVLVQDVDRPVEGPTLRQGVAQDRVLSVHDPEMRHGRKSRSKRVDGHKAAVAVDTDELLLTAVAVLPGNAQDHEQALALVEQSEAHTGCAVAVASGDCAYGDGETRQAFADAQRELGAKVPATANRGYFPKTDFQIDLERLACTCPAGRPPGRCGQARPRPGDSPSRRRCARPARCARSASRAAAVGPLTCIHRRRCSKRRACCKPATPFRRIGRGARWSNIASPAWCSWASARPATLDGPRRSSNCSWRRRWPT